MCTGTLTKTSHFSHRAIASQHFVKEIFKFTIETHTGTGILYVYKKAVITRKCLKKFKYKLVPGTYFYNTGKIFFIRDKGCEKKNNVIFMSKQSTLPSGLEFRCVCKSQIFCSRHSFNSFFATPPPPPPPGTIFICRACYHTHTHICTLFPVVIFYLPVPLTTALYWQGQKSKSLKEKPKL